MCFRNIKKHVIWHLFLTYETKMAGTLNESFCKDILRRNKQEY